MSKPGKKALERYLLMSYWNKLLLEKGIISQKDYLRMIMEIQKRYPVA